MAVNRAPIVRAIFFGAGEPATSLLNPKTSDFDPATVKLQPELDPDGAKKMLDDAGWKVGADGIRQKDGLRASFTVYGIQTTVNSGMTQAVQADLRRIGIDMHVQLWDATVAGASWRRRSSTPS
ncbi:MAG: ABC transporter substrate-binding protein [Acetobacteraceae bacterium]